ncbi:hypothetical protein LCGC14_1994720 [marine sediment metagenome]|uniref:Uncharacterized protein n=1 Tax=marine sediment metagenome TaxID=412755 RepID=A0A0F9I245_9ZZZZ
MIDLAQYGLIPWESRLVKVGDKFNRLTVLAIGKIPKTFRYYAVCKCDCGNEKIWKVRLDGMRDGNIRSCGCLQIESAVKHGNWDHHLYPMWSHMMSRCYNEKDKRYEYYGGRGIQVCEEWHDLNNFIADISKIYKKGLQIDRIDNDGNYEPSNCRFSTPTEQSRNRSSNIKITHNGKTLCLMEWSEVTGICYGTLWDRIKVLNWSPSKALTTKPRKRCKTELTG